MPVYPYYCPECGREEEVVASIHEDHAKPECHGSMRRIYSIEIHNDIRRHRIGGYVMSERAEQNMREETRLYSERESALVTDSKGSPYLDDKMNPITRHEWNAKWKRKYQEANLA